MQSQLGKLLAPFCGSSRSSLIRSRASGASELTRDGRHETALQRFRDGMTDGLSNLSDFTAIQRVRGDPPDAVQSALQSGHGEKAPLLRGVLREVDQTMENSSEGFLAANRNFIQAPRDLESIQAGREATTRGRS
jgi:hypothetical protein